MNTWGPPKKSTILLVTEDGSACRAIRESLAPARFEVVEAASAKEGIEVYRQSHPDLVLLDASGSATQPLRFCKAIRTKDPSAALPIVVLAGEGDQNLVRECHEAGMTDVIAKPVPDRFFAHRLQFLLEAGEQRRKLTRDVERMTEAQRFAGLGTWEWSISTRTLEFSEEARRILCLAKGRKVATVDSVLRTVPSADRSRVRAWLEEASQGGIGGTIEHTVSDQDGEERIVRQHATIVSDKTGMAEQISVVVMDITEWRKAEVENRYQSQHDVVTGLENIDRFLQRLEEASWLAQRSDSRFAVFYLGVARFGRIHESLGHRFGDQVLKHVAERMHCAIRKTDWICNISEEQRLPRLARLAGAHFAILLQPIDRVEDMARLASRINEAFAEPIVWEDKELFLSTNVGISIFPDDGVEPEVLVQRAQAAMQLAQTKGLTEPQFSTAQMTQEGAERLTLESSLRHALELEQFEAYYQPKVEIATGLITGLEALIRWNHPEDGLVPPVKFISVAEETGLIVPMGEWMLRTACRQAKAWQDAGYRPFPIAVNASVDQFRRANISEVVANVLEETGLDARWLEIELTESGLMDDSEGNLAILEELKSQGIKLSVDDFGTGYSSLAYLRRFPIDVLKIDRSFIMDLPGDADAATIVTTITHMARSLNLKIVAEGVETVEQLAFLRELGCDQYQGYLYSKPVPADSITVLLEDERNISGAA